MGCDTPQALPSVYRGQKIVIAGDERQLPPLTLFRTTDGQEEDTEEEFEAISSPSILNLAKSLAEYVPEKLELHYST